MRLFKKWKKYFAKKSEPIYFSKLPQHLRERVLTKFDWKSYFRLQQTCRQMADFIQNCRNVTIYFPNRCLLSIHEGHNGFPDFCGCDYRFSRKDMDFESLHGVRFPDVKIYSDYNHKNFFKNVCKTLKNYRITAITLDTERKYNAQQLEQLFEILKPEKVILSWIDSDIFALLFKEKQLKDIKGSMGLEDTHQLEKFIDKCHKLDLRVEGHAEMREYVAIIARILNYLRFQPLPNLRSFSFFGCADGRPLLDADMTSGTLSEFSPILVEFSGPRERPRYLYECRLGRVADCICKLTIREYSIQVEFKNTRTIAPKIQSYGIVGMTTRRIKRLL